MRLKTSRAHAEEQLVAVLNDGYALLTWIQDDHEKNGRTTEAMRALRLEEWGRHAQTTLLRTFPTPLENNQFLNPPDLRPMRTVRLNADLTFLHIRQRLEDLLMALGEIIKDSLPRYTDLPIQERLYVEDIDSFRQVRDVNPNVVSNLLSGGYLDVAEDFVQMNLEQILGVAFHKKDWGGEYNDLYTANVLVNGARTASAFLLKGNGLKKKTMEISDCGKNGDQIVRLFESPAKLFLIQFVGNIAEAVVKDAAGKVRELKARGVDAHFCIMDGQDTARVLRAYGKL